MIGERDVVTILEVLERAGLATIVDGGWGVDALVGTSTRPHEDLDLVIERHYLETAVDAVSALGFEHDPTARPGRPARFVLCGSFERQVDFHPIVVDPAGNGWQQLSASAWGLYTADGLRGVGHISRRRVRCITPELQLQHHLGYSWSDIDRHDMRLLRDHFALLLPPGEQS